MDRRRRAALTVSAVEGAVNWASGGIADSFVTQAILSCGGTAAHIGALSSLPAIIGCFGQLLVRVPAADGTGRRVALVARGIFAQTLLLLAIAFSVRASSALGVVSCSVAIGSIGVLVSPSWSELMGDLVPVSTRGKYFALRNAAGIAANTAALWLASLARDTSGLATVFLLSAVLRLTSSVLTLFVWDPARAGSTSSKAPDVIGAWRAIRTAPHRLRVLGLLVATASAGVLGGSFFGKLVLVDLSLGANSLVLINGTTVFARFVGSLLWGSASDRLGSNSVVLFSAALAIPFSLLTLFTRSLWGLVILSALQGAALSGLDSVALPLLLSLVPVENTTGIIALYNVVNGIGSLASGAIAATSVSVSSSWVQFPALVPMALGVILRISTIWAFAVNN